MSIMNDTQQNAKNRAKDLLQQGKSLTEDQVRQLMDNDPDAVVFYILLLQAKNAVKTSTPSGMVPVYEKPSTKKRKKSSGREQGHEGSRRPTPPTIDQRVEHRLESCPDCGSELRPCTSKKSQRTRIIEDIPEDIKPIVTEHTIHRDYCPNCKKLVEPNIPDALPGSTIGNRLLTLSAHWHYGLGMSISQIVELLNFHLHFRVSEGGLVQMWKRLSDHFEPWYEQLAEEIRESAVLHADETGWRVNGKTHWLWCFTNEQSTVYMIDKSRGSPALYEFFKEAFEGILVTDFWAAYDSIASGNRQFCLAHLLRELEKVDSSNSSEEWCAFSKKTKRLFLDALRLRKRDDFSPETYMTRIQRLNERLIDLMLIESSNADVQRLAKRLRKYWDDLLTFLDHPSVPATNNHAEREIRPAVIMRKVVQGNRSDKGARTQTVLMTIFRTLKRIGHNSIDTLCSSLQNSILTGDLSPFSSIR
jgi:transposase